MSDTINPIGDHDRPSDREVARSPRRPAVGAPEGTASSGSASPPLDMALLRTLEDEFGYWPATTDIERHRRLNAAPDHCPQGETWAEAHRMMGHHPHPAPTKGNPERWDCDCGYIWRILTGEQIRTNTVNAERGWIGDPQPTAEQRKHSVEVCNRHWCRRRRYRRRPAQAPPPPRAVKSPS